MCSRADLDLGLQAISRSILEQSSAFLTRWAFSRGSILGVGGPHACSCPGLIPDHRTPHPALNPRNVYHLHTGPLHALGWQSCDWHSYFGVKLRERSMASRICNLTPLGLWLGVPYCASNMALRHTLQLLLYPVPRTTRHLV
jgi:hypothetical protein